MDKLSDDIQYKIYEFKHQLEFKVVLDELLRLNRFSKPKIGFCFRCCELYPLGMECECGEGVPLPSDPEYESDDSWMYIL